MFCLSSTASPILNLCLAMHLHSTAAAEEGRTRRQACASLPSLLTAAWWFTLIFNHGPRRAMMSDPPCNSPAKTISASP